MNLYISIMVEPKEKIKHGAPCGGQFFSSLGAIPRGDSAGPWTTKQKERIEQAVHNWHTQAPANLKYLHKRQRDNVLSCLAKGDYSFLFEFSTHDAIDLDCLQDDTRALFYALQRACRGTRMVATKFDSI